MADRFDFDAGPPNGAGNESGGTASGEPGSAGTAGSGQGGNSGIEGGDSGAKISDPELTAKGTIRKRRPGGGRKPKSPDASIGTAAGTGSDFNASGKEGLAVRNDRIKVRNSIAGLHAMAAVLTRQPILELQKQEADMLTNALCDVADYHGFNLIGAGGAFGLYATLATTGYMIYVPRFKAMKQPRVASVTDIKEGKKKQKEDTSIAGTMKFD